MEIKMIINIMRNNQIFFIVKTQTCSIWYDTEEKCGYIDAGIETNNIYGINTRHIKISDEQFNELRNSLYDIVNINI